MNTDKNSFGMVFLGFLFPVIGFIIWAVTKGDTPKKAASAITGAIIGFVVEFIIMIFYAFRFFMELRLV